MPRYFAAINSYASETDAGFANTWGVLAFDSRKARDEFVNARDDLATRAITRNQIGNYLDRTPKPFTGEKFSITWSPISEDPPAGFIGEVCVSQENAAEFIEPLN